MPKCEFSLKWSSLNVGCVFAYFCGGHKNTCPLRFRTSFNNQVDLKLLYLLVFLLIIKFCQIKLLCCDFNVSQIFLDLNYPNRSTNHHLYFSWFGDLNICLSPEFFDIKFPKLFWICRSQIWYEELEINFVFSKYSFTEDFQRWDGSSKTIFLCGNLFRFESL